MAFHVFLFHMAMIFRTVGTRVQTSAERKESFLSSMSKLKVRDVLL